MDFEEALASTSVSTQSSAALFLRSEGTNAAKYLPKLLECCRAIDLTASGLDKFKIALLGFGALTLGDVVRQIGFDPSISFHIDVLNHIVELATCENTDVSAYAINGLGCLGSTHPTAIGCLKGIIVSQVRPDDHSIVTRRALAFRMLAKLDQSMASQFRETDACREYLNTIDSWLETASPTVRQQLLEESQFWR